MKQLLIRHHAQPDGTNPTVTVVYQDPTTYETETAGPFPFGFALTEDEQRLLRWYLEEFLTCPLAVYQQRAQDATALMERLGAALFKATFGEIAAYNLYMKVREQLADTRFVVQANTSSGIALPWELIRDPSLPYGDLAYLAHAFVRGEPNLPQVAAPPPQGSTLNILLAISRPDDEKDVAFQSVARHLLDAFENQTGRVNIEVLRPATFTELSKRLTAKPGHYHVFHFDGHGTFRSAPAPGPHLYNVPGAGGKLYFEDGQLTDNKQDGLISGERLGRALAAAKVPIVLLNACQSGMTDPDSGLVSLGNELLRSGACGVVAMSYSVYVQTAAAFMKSLYERLRAGDDLAGAHKRAVVALKDNTRRRSTLGTDEHLQDWIVPVLFERAAVTPLAKVAGAGTGGAASDTEEFGVPEPPQYGFHGRDGVTLRLERAFQRTQVALLWGMAGVGKTTTAAAFARWWARTGALEGPVFFFSFEHHKTLAAVVAEIGRAYHDMLKRNGIEWEHLTASQQRRCVLDLLIEIPCFLIFDNFEPVSGFPTGMPSVWTTDEQSELRAFLAELIRKKAASRVLVTSRREKEPLLPPCAIVPLGGLPRHEALELAGAILTQHGLNQAKIRQLPKFGELLKFLGGNPLSLQVILPLLADGTKPEVLLAKLQAGTVALPESDTTEQGRDKSLTASLTYRLSALPEEDNAKLSVVGLFQGFVDANVLFNISARDDAPTELQGLSVKDWTRILSQAAEIGLLREAGKGYFTVHPALPWFFHDRLTTTFGDRLPGLEKVFATVYGQYASWLDDTFKTNPQMAMGLLSAEEPNLLHALQLSRAQQLDDATSEILYGINRLWKTQGRWEEFERLLSGVESEMQDADGEPRTGRDFLWVSVLGMRQEIAQYRRDFVAVEKMLLRLKAHYEATGDDKNVATALHQLGIIAQERRNFDEAEKWYHQSLEIKKRIGDEYGQAQSSHQLGIIAQERRNFDEAEKWYHQSLEIRKRVKDEHGTALTLGQLGRLAQDRRDFVEANKLFDEAQQTFGKLGDSANQAVSLHQLGNVAFLIQNFDEAEKWYRQSLEIRKRIGDEHGQAITLHQLGMIAQERRNFDEAENWYQQSLDVKKRIKDENGTALTLGQLGNLAVSQRQFDNAETSYREALPIFQRIGNEYGQAITLHQLGMIAQERRNFDEAEQWYRQTEGIFQRMNDPYNLAIVQRSLVRLAEARV